MSRANAETWKFGSRLQADKTQIHETHQAHQQDNVYSKTYVFSRHILSEAIMASSIRRQTTTFSCSRKCRATDVKSRDGVGACRGHRCCLCFSGICLCQCEASHISFLQYF